MANGYELKPPYHTLPLAKNIPQEIMAKEGQVMARRLKSWYHRYKEEKNILLEN